MKSLKPYTFITFLSVLQLFGISVLSQSVAINENGSSADPSALLHLQSNSKGLLIPRLTTTQRQSINSPATGLWVFDTETVSFWSFNGTTWEEMLGTPDNLGNHRFTQNFLTNGNWISNDGQATGLSVSIDGKVGVGINATSAQLEIGLTPNQSTLLKFGLDRPWQFMRNGTGAAETLWLKSMANRGRFTIMNADKSRAIAQFQSDLLQPEVHLVPAGGKVAIGGNTSEKTLTVIGSGYFQGVLQVNGNLPATNHFSGQSTQFHQKLEVLGVTTITDSLFAESAHFAENVVINGITHLDDSLFLGSHGFPKTGALPDHYLALNTNGNFSWQKIGLQDHDSDTKIAFDQSPNDDSIRFYLGGNEHIVFSEKDGNPSISFHNNRHNIFVGDGVAFTAGLPDSANIFIGSHAGQALDGSGATQNVVLGARSGYLLTSGSKNVFLGAEAGLSATQDSENVLIGGQVNRNGQNNHNNVMIGSNAGKNAQSSSRNVLLGYQSGENLNNAHDNVLIGFQSGKALTTGSQNTVMGTGAGSGLQSGDGNVIIGHDAAVSRTSGEGNVLIGKNVGGTNSTPLNHSIFIGENAGQFAVSDSSIFIGRFAGQNITENKRLEIGSLIYGEFDNRIFRVNGLYSENGNAWGRFNSAAEKMPIGSVFGKNRQLKAFRFSSEGKSGGATKFGFDPSDFQDAFPELVKTINAEKDVLGINYMAMIPLLLEGLKQQHQTIVRIQNESMAELETLSAEIKELNKLLRQLENDE